MIVQNDCYIYISIKFKDTGARTIFNLVKTFVKKGESLNKVAKALRKDLDYSYKKGSRKFVPSDFSWHVYEKVVNSHELKIPEFKEILSSEDIKGK